MSIEWVALDNGLRGCAHRVVVDDTELGNLGISLPAPETDQRERFVKIPCLFRTCTGSTPTLNRSPIFGCELSVSDTACGCCHILNLQLGDIVLR